MYPIIRAKCLSLPENISYFNDVGVILYYEVLKQGSRYDRIDAVFDWYFDRSLKEATQISTGIGTRLKITELCDIPKNFEISYTSARIRMILMSILLKNLSACIMINRY